VRPASPEVAAADQHGFGLRGIIAPMSDEQWYYCLKHGTVEKAEGCRAADRLGPYPDRESAAHALELAHQRTAANDAADDAWEERGTRFDQT
jgi:hypothetical protein